MRTFPGGRQSHTKSRVNEQPMTAASNGAIKKGAVSRNGQPRPVSGITRLLYQRYLLLASSRFRFARDVIFPFCKTHAETAINLSVVICREKIASRFCCRCKFSQFWTAISV